jgi:Mrp family chromosome partitioning ATPase
MLSAGCIATAELLRMTAPRLSPAFASAPLRAAEPVMASPPTVPAMRDSHPDLAAPLTEIDQLAEQLLGAGEGAHKIVVLGSGQGESITLTALTLARLLARSAKVVVVDLSASSPAFAAVSADPMAPGLAELMLGEASFAQVITRDRLSRAHLVAAGRQGADRSLLQSPRLALALDALLRVYDHVLLDAGTASDLPAELLTANARAVVVPDASMNAEARKLMADQLRDVGFSDVTMLSKPSQPADIVEPGRRVVAA